jgi:hypothetical protein
MSYYWWELGFDNMPPDAYDEEIVIFNPNPYVLFYVCSA